MSLTYQTAFMRTCYKPLASSQTLYFLFKVRRARVESARDCWPPAQEGIFFFLFFLAALSARSPIFSKKTNKRKIKQRLCRLTNLIKYSSDSWFVHVQYDGKNRCPNFRGLFTTKVINSHVRLHAKSDAQNCELHAATLRFDMSNILGDQNFFEK